LAVNRWKHALIDDRTMPGLCVARRFDLQQR
jgi:hypothetical protein